MKPAFSKQIFFLPLFPTLTFTDPFSSSAAPEGTVPRYRGKSHKEHTTRFSERHLQDERAFFSLHLLERLRLPSQ